MFPGCQGSRGSPTMKFPDPFSDKVPIFTDFLQHENTIFWPSPKFTRVTQMQKKKEILQRPFGKKISMVCHLCAVPTKTWQFTKYHGNTFPIFLAFLVANCETGQPYHDMDSQNLKWGLHIDIISIFPDFLVNFKCHISKFTDFFLTFKNFNIFLTFSYLWEPWL